MLIKWVFCFLYKRYQVTNHTHTRTQTEEQVTIYAVIKGFFLPRTTSTVAVILATKTQKRVIFACKVISKAFTGHCLMLTWPDRF